MILLYLSIAVFVATFLGGSLAIYLKDRLHLILGFSAGAVIAVAFFDLIPEAIELTEGQYEPTTVLSLTALGFVTYLFIDRIFLLPKHGLNIHEKHPARGRVGATSLSIHSFLDGVAIGLAFQVSPAVGAVVATAVLAHDFSDGINTVNMILKNKGSRRQAFNWLLVDAAAPVLGIISTVFYTAPQADLGLLLGLFAGFFLYIGASDLIPESYHNHPVYWTTFSTILGVAVLYTVIQIAGV